MYNESKYKERKHFCMHCLQCFSSEIILANQVKNCLTVNGNQAINMLKKGENILKFNNLHKQLPVPFVIYADFEAITKKLQGCKQSEEMEKEKEKRSYAPKPIRLSRTVVVDIRSYVAMMTNIANQSKRIEVKTPSINLWKRCSKRSNTVKLSLRKCLTNHWL